MEVSVVVSVVEDGLDVIGGVGCVVVIICVRSFPVLLPTTGTPLLGIKFPVIGKIQRGIEIGIRIFAIMIMMSRRPPLFFRIRPAMTFTSRVAAVLRPVLSSISRPVVIRISGSIISSRPAAIGGALRFTRGFLMWLSSSILGRRRRRRRRRGGGGGGRRRRGRGGGRGGIV